MAKNLSRTKLKQISDAWDAGLLAGNSKTIKRGGRQTILVYNATGGRLKPGDIVELKGFRASLTFDNAQSRALNNNLVIKAVTPTTDSNSAALAAIDGVIEPGGVGRAVTDIILAVVTFSSDSHIYVTAALTSTKEKSTFIVLARSGASAGKRVCVLGRACRIEDFEDDLRKYKKSKTVATDFYFSFDEVNKMVVLYSETEDIDYFGP
ncbi:MAG TPA: hypothetical protein GX530_08125 [Corynebacteriales bacterium]|nr:hypothetical protein [Mycobacteriales bacterium]